MTLLEALILGLVQGLTEFLPVSSSGHIELGKALLNVEAADDLTFSIIVHGATVLSILVVFRRDIRDIVQGVLQFKWNTEMKMFSLILISMIPVGIVGVFFEDEVESFFNGRIMLVGAMLLVTATILYLTRFSSNSEKDISNSSALIIGIAQAIAVLPGISRSGATIGTALLLGIDKTKATSFSFLMVVPPILGATLLKVKDLAESPSTTSLETMPLVVGFAAAFVSGLIACQWMIKLVRRGKIAYFAWYCAAAGIAAIVAGM